MLVQIKDLKLKTIIGFMDWEREKKQEVLINIDFEFDGKKATESDDIKDGVDYKIITKKIIAYVEKSEYKLLEKLASSILELVREDEKILWARVEVDKPGALRFSESVSVVVER